MGNIFSKIKAAVSGIHWPSKKEVIRDTIYVMCTTVVLSLLIMGWTTLIDLVIGLFI